MLLRALLLECYRTSLFVCVLISSKCLNSTGAFLDGPPPPAHAMVGLATMAVPLVMRLVSQMAGSSDMATAAPGAISADAAASIPRATVPGYSTASRQYAGVGSSASVGCQGNKQVALDTTLNVALGDRRYLLYFPVNYKPDTPAPLVLSYHGGTRTAEIQQALDLLTSTYFNQDYITVYPNGINARLSRYPT